jgi:hypothetical protein
VTNLPYQYSNIPNSIGEFIIGESPIGSEGFDWSKTLVSQYANSPILLALIASFAANVDQTQNIDAFYDNVWNVLTAQGYGLDVWGRIVGVSRVLTLTMKFFGFEEAGDASVDPFNTSPFYTGLPATSNFSLSDSAYLQLILAKAAANIWDGSIPALNAILRILFPGQIAYVVDGLNMTLTYYFGFALNPVQYAIASSVGILPRPTGVMSSVVQL